MARRHLVIFGMGYCGSAVARLAAEAGFAVTGIRRQGGVLPDLTHALITVPPGELQDPIWATYGPALRAATGLRWLGYLSTTGVYGDRGGGWVDEATPVAPGAERSRRRVAVEADWASLGDHVAVDLFRVAGIYGPGRSAFDDLRSGRARRVAKPGHSFGRIHRDDIAGAVLAAMRQELSPGVRVLHLADDTPAESEAVIAEAAELLGVPAPPRVGFAQAWAGMSPMARSFWAENRLVSSARTQQVLGYRWRYPSYREGLRAILAEERAEGGT